MGAPRWQLWPWTSASTSGAAPGVCFLAWRSWVSSARIEPRCCADRAEWMALLICCWLVVTGTWLLFSHILGIVIPVDKYVSEGLKPPTRLVNSGLIVVHSGYIVVDTGIWMEFNGYMLDVLWIFWVSLITTEACSPEPWNHGLYREIIPMWGLNSGGWITIVYPDDGFSWDSNGYWLSEKKGLVGFQWRIRGCNWEMMT